VGERGRLDVDFSRAKNIYLCRMCGASGHLSHDSLQWEKQRFDDLCGGWIEGVWYRRLMVELLQYEVEVAAASRLANLELTPTESFRPSTGCLPGAQLNSYHRRQQHDLCTQV